MTLIISAINKRFACTVTDTLVTRNGKPVEVNAVKSMRVDCVDGAHMISFTGIAHIANIPVMDWLTTQLQQMPASKRTTVEVIDHVKDLLSKQMAGMFRQPLLIPHLRLIVVFNGWVRQGTRIKPQIQTLTNTEDAQKNWLAVPTQDFRHINMTNEKLVVHGYKPATQTDEFAQRQKYAKSLIRKNRGILASPVRDIMAELVILASAHSAGTIGDKVMGSVLHKGGEGLDFQYYPESRDWIAPNFVNKNMAVSGLKVKNDFVQGGKTVIGGSIPELDEILKQFTPQ